MNTNCWTCGCKLDVLDVLNMPQEPIIDLASGKSVDTVANICLDCYVLMRRKVSSKTAHGMEM